MRSFFSSVSLSFGLLLHYPGTWFALHFDTFESVHTTNKFNFNVIWCVIQFEIELTDTSFSSFFLSLFVRLFTFRFLIFHSSISVFGFLSDFLFTKLSFRFINKTDWLIRIWLLSKSNFTVEFLFSIYPSACIVSSVDRILSIFYKDHLRTAIKSSSS